MEWLLLVIAGCFEVFFVLFMKLSEGFRHKGYTLLCIVSSIISFGLLAQVMKTMPLGLSYAVWTGIGATLNVIIGILFFGESKNKTRLFFISMVVIGLVGLKWASS
ncbi:DMT family transporter [Massilibacterium senegalense]|uniref:DMT family transporter n=1 Tax=Massilibacterium senegalense TaxID=1632858 RepID=UPI000784CD58|nr:multidrug efflux SMR transporter [Massilibacterium senegalense]